jgi:hypothetical protein
MSIDTNTKDPKQHSASNETYQELALRETIKTSLAFFSVTAHPKPPKIPRYVLYGKADVDLEWQGYTFRLQSFTWRVHRNNANIVVIFPIESYPDPHNKPGHRIKKFTVPTFTVIPDEGYQDLKSPIQECIRSEVRKRFGGVIDEYLKHKGVPKEALLVKKESWQIKPHYDEYRVLERERWDTPPGDNAPDPIDVEVVELYEDEKCIEGKSTKRYAIRGTAHVDLKLEGYAFEIRNLFWGIKHQSYKVMVKSPNKTHHTQYKDPINHFVTLGFRPFTPEGNRDLQLKILDTLSLEILKLYAKDIEKRKPEFQHAYEAIRSDVKRRRAISLSMKKPRKRLQS